MNKEQVILRIKLTPDSKVHEVGPMTRRWAETLFAPIYSSEQLEIVSVSNQEAR